jgi:hypothetical protein
MDAPFVVADPSGRDHQHGTVAGADSTNDRARCIMPQRFPYALCVIQGSLASISNCQFYTKQTSPVC